MGTGPLFDLLLTLGLAGLLWQISQIDRARHVIPNALVAVLWVGGMIFAGSSGLHNLIWHMGWAALVFTAGFGLSIIAEKQFGQPALGMGDVKLFAVATFWIGPEWLGLMLAMAATTALCFAWLTKTKGARIAFGPHLSAALFAIWCVTAMGRATQ